LSRRLGTQERSEAGSPLVFSHREPREKAFGTAGKRRL
jgi:hypothetical protein